MALTELPVANFFSVPTSEPVRCAALMALRPLTTVSRLDAPARALLPILVTWSQPSFPGPDMLADGRRPSDGVV